MGYDYTILTLTREFLEGIIEGREIPDELDWAAVCCAISVSVEEALALLEPQYHNDQAGYF